MRRYLLLSSLAFGLLLLGLATLSGNLIALSIPIVFYLIAALLYGPEQLQFQITRTLSDDRVSQGAPVAVKLSVTNLGSHLEEARVEDLVPQPLKVTQGDSHILAPFPPGHTIDLEYIVRGRRGHYDFQDVQVTACDQLGLFQRQMIFSAPQHLLVLPKTTKLRRVAIRPLQTRGYAGPVPSRQGGSGVDFFGVREYRVGDPLRWINWRMSARHPRTLFTNEFEQERIADVGLILDARQRSEVRVKGESLFEHAIHATASLAETFLNAGNRVGLLVYGGFLDWVFPGYGKVQRERILRALTRAEPGESLIFNNLDYLPTRFFPTRSQIVLISPLCIDDLQILVRLKARGYQVMVISPDPVTFEVQRLGSQPVVELAARIARVERVLLLRKLQQVGIQLVNWQVGMPLDQAIHTSLGRLPHWFRAVGLEMRL